MAQKRIREQDSPLLSSKRLHCYSDAQPSSNCAQSELRPPATLSTCLRLSCGDGPHDPRAERLTATHDHAEAHSNPASDLKEDHDGSTCEGGLEAAPSPFELSSPAAAQEGLQSGSKLAAVLSCASQTPPALPLDPAEAARRVFHFDQLTAALRETLPEAQRSKWDAAVAKLKARVAQRPQFGANVNDFLMLLRRQMDASKENGDGSPRPSARATLFHFMQMKLGEQKRQRLPDGSEEDTLRPVAA